jgi:hypothetical protein
MKARQVNSVQQADLCRYIINVQFPPTTAPANTEVNIRSSRIVGLPP